MTRHRRSPEAQIQKALVQHLRLRGPRDLFFFHPANGGLRSRVEGAVLKGLGVVPGVPDIVIIHGGRVYGLELKPDSGGRLTDAQRASRCATATKTVSAWHGQRTLLRRRRSARGDQKAIA